MGSRSRKPDLEATFEVLEPRLMLSSVPTVGNLSESTDEDTPLAAMVAGSDADGDSLTFFVTSQPSHGELTFTDFGFYTYTPDADYNSTISGNDTFQFKANDGMDDSASAATVTITINAVNDAPVLGSIEAMSLEYTENDDATAISTAVEITDVDDTNIEGGTVQITGNYQSDQDVLSFTDIYNITDSWNSGTGTLTLSGQDTLAHYQEAIRSVKYNNTQDNPNTTTRTVTFKVNDGDEDSLGLTRGIAILPGNDAPSISGLSGTLDYTEGDPASVLDEDVTVSDVDSPNLDNGTLTVEITANAENKDRLEINNEGTGTGQISVSGNKVSYEDTEIGTFKGGIGAKALVVTFNENSTLAAAERLIENITYRSLSANPSAANRTVQFTLADGDRSESDSPTVTVDISDAAANDAPVNTVPGTQEWYQGSDLYFSKSRNNAISIKDVDAGSNDVEVTLTATHGTMTLSGTTGLDITTGDGTDDATMVFTGTIDEINTALDGMYFTTDDGENSANLQIVTDDQGYTGTGGALTDTDSVTINLSDLEVWVSGPSEVDEGSVFTLYFEPSESVSDWDIYWGDSSSDNDLSAALRSYSHTYSDDNASYTIVVKANNEGYTAPNFNITANNVVPVINFDVADAEVERGTDYTLDLSATDPGSDTMSYWKIDWGDGTYTEPSGADPSPQIHSYPTDTGPANYVIQVTARDEDISNPDVYYAAPLAIAVTVADYAFEQEGGHDPDEASTSLSGTDDQYVKLLEGNSFYSALYRDITIPDNATKFNFVYSNYYLDTNDTDAEINDAFEVALLGEDGDSLVPTIGWGRDAFFNVSEGESVLIASSGVTHDTTNKTLTLDISHLEAGTKATLYVRLINNDDDDMGSYIELPAVMPKVSSNVSVNEGAAYSLNLSLIGPGGSNVKDTSFFVLEDDTTDNIYRYDSGGTVVNNDSVQDGNNDPRGIAFHEYAASEDLAWVVDSDKTVYIYKYGTGNEADSHGSWTPQTESSAALNTPTGIATDGTDIWILDSGNDKVYFYDGGADWTTGTHDATGAGTFSLDGDNADASGLTFGQLSKEVYHGKLTDVDLDTPSAGTTTLTDSGADFGTDVVGAKITLSGAGEFSITARTSTTAIQISDPNDDAANATGESYVIVATDNYLWVTDDESGGSEENRVYVYTSDGALQGSWNLDPNNDNPTGITTHVDSGSNYADSEDLWVVDKASKKIYRYTGGTRWLEGGRASDSSVSLHQDNDVAEGLAYYPGQWRITWGDGTPVESVNAANSSATKYYADDGSYAIDAYVVYGSNDQKIASDFDLVVGAVNVAPALGAGAGFESWDDNGTNRFRAHFSGNFRDPGFTLGGTSASETFTLTIDWGDGSNPEQVTPTVINGRGGTDTIGYFSVTHDYSTTGDITATVTVTDDDHGTVDGSDTAIFSYTLVSLTVGNINLKSNGVVNVDVEWTEDGWKPEDKMDADSLRLGPGEAREEGYPDAEWSNPDGKRVQFRNTETGISPGDSVVFMTGNFISGYKGGQQFIAMGDITIVEGSEHGGPGVTEENRKLLTIDSHVYTSGNNKFNMVFGYQADGTDTGNAEYWIMVDGSNNVLSKPTGIASNTSGTKVWTLDVPDDLNSPIIPYVTVWEPSAGTLKDATGSWSAGGVTMPTGITTDGTNIWMVDADSSELDVVYFMNGAAQMAGFIQGVDQFDLDPANSNPTDIVTYGEHFWVTNDESGAARDKVFVYDAAGNLVDLYKLDAANTDTTGITLDASSPTSTVIWTVDKGDAYVYKYATGRSFGERDRELTAENDQNGSFALNGANDSPEGIADPPTVSVTPPDLPEVLADSTVLLTGQATLDSGYPLESVTINDELVDVVDGAGNFFTLVDVGIGETTFTVEATDTNGTDSESLTLTGVEVFSGDIDWSWMFDATQDFTFDYDRTTFNHKDNVVFAELDLTAGGLYVSYGPLLVAVRNIDEPGVEVYRPDGVTPEGLPYYLVTDVTVDGNGCITAGSLEIAFKNPDRVQFDYDLVVLARINRRPVFTSVPVVEVLEGEAYNYTVQAVDPEGTPVAYSLKSAPDTMVVNSYTGVIAWSDTDTVGEEGQHVVVVRATDNPGAYRDQSFILTVIDPIPNRPPVFVSEPITDAYANLPYVYDAVAEDADEDTLTFSGSVDHDYFEYAAEDSFSLDSANENPTGMATDGSSIWVTDDDTDDKVYVYYATSDPDPVEAPNWQFGDLKGSWTLDDDNADPAGIAVDSFGDLWVLDSADEKVYHYVGGASWTSGTHNDDESFSLHADNDNPTGISTDGETLWVTDNNGTSSVAKVFVYDLTSETLGTHLSDKTFETLYRDTDPLGLSVNAASDQLWVIDADEEVYVYDYSSGNEGDSLGRWTADGLEAPVAIARNALYVYVLDDQTGGEKVLRYDAGGWTQLSHDFDVDSSSGQVTWTPPAELVDRDVEITLTVTDGTDSAIQRYSIYVHEEPRNHDPIITSTAPTTATASGDTSSDWLCLDLSVGETTTQTVSLQLPQVETVGGADIIFVVDESGSMRYEHDWLEDMITHLDAELATRGITDTRYGLVGFGGSGDHYWGHSHYMDENQRLWGTAEEFADASDSLVITGDTEDGYDGIDYALDQYTFRSNAAVNIILVTDEDRDAKNDTLDKENIKAALKTYNAKLNVVVNATFEDGSGVGALGVDWEGNAYTASNSVLVSYNTALNLGTDNSILIEPNGQGGYTHSAQTRTFDDISTSGTAILQGYADADWYDLDTSVPEYSFIFYGVPYDKFYVSTDGLITLDGAFSMFEYGYDNYDLEDTPPQQAIAVLWDDLVVPEGEEVYWDIKGTGQDERLIIQWENVKFQGLSTQGEVTFQAELYSNGNIHLNYEDIDGGGTGHTDGASATVGIRDVALVVYTSTGGVVKSDWGTTTDDYINLAWDPAIGGIRGAAWDLNILRRGGDEAKAFTDTFVEIKAQEIEDQLAVELHFPSEEAGVVTSVSDPIYSEGGRVISFDVEFTGDGGAHRFDLNFVNTYSNEILGTVPVSINDHYLYDVEAVDPDLDTLAYELVGRTHGAGIDESTGVITWRPAVEGEYDFTVRVTDGRGGEDTEDWTVIVASVGAANTDPALTPSSLTDAVIDRPYAYDVSADASDADDDALRYYLTETLTGMAIDFNTGLFTWTPVTGQSGTGKTFKVRVYDAHGGSSGDQTYTIDVLTEEQVNTAPTFAEQDVPLQAVVGELYRFELEASDANEDPISFNVLMGPEGMAVHRTQGVLVWTPMLDQVGAHDVAVRVRDRYGGQDVLEFQITVVNLNDPPVFTSTPLTEAIEDSQYRYQVTAEDPNGDVVSFQLHPEADEIMDLAEDSTSGEWWLTWTPGTGDAGAYWVVMAATDARGGVAYQRFVLTVSDTNAPPVFLSDTIAVATAGSQWTYTPVVEDPENEEVTLTLDAASLDRGITISSGQLSWTPDEVGEYRVTITATDTQGAWAKQWFDLPVVPAKVTSAPPVITSVPYGPAYVGVEYKYELTGYDPEEASLTWDDDQAGGSWSRLDVYQESGKWYLKGTPIDGDEGSSYDVIVYADDNSGSGVRTYQKFTLPVDDQSPPSNQTPVITSRPAGPAYVNEEWEYYVEAYDPDGDDLTYSIETNPGWLNNSGNRFYGTPTTTDGSPVTIKVRATDDSVNYDQEFTLTVLAERAQTEEDHAPVITSVPYGPAYEGVQWSYQVIAADPDGEVLEYSIHTGPQNGGSRTSDDPNDMWITEDGLVTWTPWTDASTSSPHDVEIRVTDGTYTLSHIFKLPVEASVPSNSAPEIASMAPTEAYAGKEYTYQVDAYDPNGDTLYYSLEEAPADMSIDENGLVRWFPMAADSTGHTVKVEVTDSEGNTSLPQEYTLIVKPEVAIDQAPEFTSEPPSPATRGKLYRYQVTAIDPNGDTIDYSFGSNKPDDMTIDGVTGLIEWTPSEAQAQQGSFLVEVVADDTQPGTGNWTTQSFWLPVVYNMGPIVNSVPSPLTAEVNRQYSYQVDASDPNGDDITYTLLGGSEGSVSPTGLYTWTADATDLANEPDEGYLIEIMVSDGFDGGWGVQWFYIDVIAENAGNSAPTIDSWTPRGTIQIGQTYLATIPASDLDGDALSYELVSGPDGMFVEGGTGLIHWTPTEDQLGTTQDFTVRAYDGTVYSSNSGPHSVSVVGHVSNTAPQITSHIPQVYAVAGYEYRYQATATDADGDPLMWYVYKGPEGMDVDAGTGLVLWTPTSEQADQSHDVQLAVTDSYATMVQSWTQLVLGANTPPTIKSAPPTQAMENKKYTYAVHVDDPDDTELTFALTTKPTGMSIGSDGLITWESPITTGSPHPIVIEVTDSRGDKATQGYDLTVISASVNVAPVIETTPDLYYVELGEPFTYDVDARDANNEDILTYSVSSPTTSPDIANYINSISGLINWIPNDGGGNSYDITVTVTDDGAGTLSTTQVFTLYVLSSNATPVIDPTLVTAYGTVNVPFVYQVPATDADGDIWLTYELTTKPEGMQIDALGRITWMPTTADDYDVTVKVTDSAGAWVDDPFTLTINADTTDPSLGFACVSNVVYVGQDAKLYVEGWDASGLKKLEVIFDKDGPNETPLRVLPNGTATMQMETAGEFTFTGIATDNNNRTTSLDIDITVITRPATTPPNVDITSPVDEDEITEPVDIIGSIDLNGGGDVTYYFEVAPMGSGEYVRIGDDVTVDQNTTGKLGELDPTALRGGMYDLRMVATNSSGTIWTAPVLVEVSDLVLGDFQLSFTDLSIPVGGIPITISRHYDTLDSSRLGDFGYGWRIGIFETGVSVDLPSSGQPSSGWEWDVPAFAYGTRLYVTLPDGTKEGFTFVHEPLDPSSDFMGAGDIAAGLLYGLLGLGQVSLVPDMGNTTELSLTGTVPQVFLVEDGTYRTADGMNFNPASLFLNLDYQITSQDGLEYNIDGTTGELKNIVDPNGNTLVVTDTSITAYTRDREVAARITLQRGQYGITEITDPAGESITYEYDAVTGDLISMTNREGKEIGFNYDASRAHFLTEIVRDPDSANETIMKVQFDSAGRVTGITDASGNVAPISYTINAGDGLHAEQIQDADGNLTEIVKDAEGNVVRRIQHMPDPMDRTNLQEVTDHITVYEYDADGNLTKQRVPFEVVEKDLGTNDTRYNYLPSGDPVYRQQSTYDEYGRILTTTDAEGGETRYRYGDYGNITRMVDATGYATEYDYDSRGNQTQVRRQVGVDGDGAPLWETTKYTYANGNLTQVLQVDGSGQETVAATFTYDSAGRIASVLNIANDAADSDTDQIDMIRYFVYDANGNQIISYYYWDDPNDGNKAVDNTVANHTSYDKEGRVTATEQYVYDTVKTFTAGYDFGDDGSYRLWSTSTTYNDAGQVETSTDKFGTQTTYVYDDRGNLVETYTQAKDASGTDVFVVTRTVYDDNGRAIYTTDPHEEAISGGKPDPAAAHGTRTVYDAMGRVVLQERRKDLLLEIDTSGDCVVSDSDNSSAIYFTQTEYNATGQVSEVTYDNNGDPTDADDRHSVEYTYDTAGRQTKVTQDRDGDSSTTTDRYADLYEYDAAGRQISYTQDSDGDTGTTGDQTTIEYEYDGAGRLIETTYPDPDDAGPGVVTYLTVEYDAFGRRVAETDQMDNTTRYEYDDAGRLTAVVLPEISHPDTSTLGSARYEYEYDVYGNQALIRDNVFVVSSTAQVLYDHDGNAGEDDRETTFEYDYLNRQTKRTLPEGQVEQFFYDDSSKDGQLDYAIDFEGRYTEYEYDSFGRVEIKYYYENSTSWNSGNGTPDEGVLYTYDSLGRVLSVEDLDVRLTKGGESGGTSLAVGDQVYEFDTSNNKLDGEGYIQRIDGTHIWIRTTAGTWDNGLGTQRISKENDTPANYQDYTTTDDYTAVNGSLTQYTYTDGRNTKIETTKEGSSSVDYTVNYVYDDQIGLITRMYTGTGSEGNRISDIGYDYDTLGRLTTVTVYERDTAAPDPAEVTSYTYDAVGNLETVERPNGAGGDGNYTVYTYDDLNRLIEVRHYDTDQMAATRARFQYTLQADGKRTQVVETDHNGNATTIQWAYDALGRLTTETYNAYAAGPDDYLATYTFDLVGNRTKKVVQIDADDDDTYETTDSIAYTYDDNDRLLYEKIDDGNDSSVDTTIVYEYGPGADPINGDGGDHTVMTKKTTYDGDGIGGSKEAETTNTYTYQGRLEKAEINSDGDANIDIAETYTYNDSGIRVGKVVQEDTDDDGDYDVTTNIDFVIDAANHTGYAQVIEEWNPDTTNLDVSYTIGHDHIAQWDDSTGDVLYLLADGHGSTRLLTDDAGAVAQNGSTEDQVFDYDAYGNMLTSFNGDVLTTLLYTGEQFNSTTGQYYLRARYYDPATGRFNRLDPLAGNNQDPVTLHKYLYCGANPVNLIDPTGQLSYVELLTITTIMGTLGGGIVGASVARYYYGYSVTEPEFWAWVAGGAVVGGVAGYYTGWALVHYGYVAVAGGGSLGTGAASEINWLTQNSNRANHILQSHHHWSKVANVPSQINASNATSVYTNQVLPIIQRVVNSPASTKTALTLTNGVGRDTYTGIVSGYTVEVRIAVLDNGLRLIENALVMP